MVYAGRKDRGRICHPRCTRPRRIRTRLVTKWKDEAGAELLEAALILPVLLMLLLGIIAFGRAWNTYQTITRAAREGARMAVLTPCAVSTYCSGATNYTATDIWNNFINPSLQAANLDPTKVQNPSIKYVWIDASDVPPYICGIQVSFTYPYTFLLPFTSVNATTINLSTAVQMRLENQPASCPVGSDY
jgi:Flp pilus assembly protein TadG